MTAMNVATIELTEQEANALIQMMDAAVRHDGLTAAGAAAQLAVKIQRAFQPKEPEADDDRKKTDSNK